MIARHSSTTRKVKQNVDKKLHAYQNLKNEFPIYAFADTAWTETQKRPGNIREKDTTVNAEATQPRIQQFSVIRCTYL